jgi:hypothetical protein
VRGSHSCLLAPAPIGELQPPLQQCTLRNGGPAPLAYRWVPGWACACEHVASAWCCRWVVGRARDDRGMLTECPAAALLPYHTAWTPRRCSS